MSIKDKLAEELENASKEEEKRKLERKASELEAIELFKPIMLAMQELGDQLKDVDGLSIRASENSVNVKLGEVTTLESSRYFFTNEFSIDEKNRWGYPSYETMERSHKFDTS